MVVVEFCTDLDFDHESESEHVHYVAEFDLDFDREPDTVGDFAELGVDSKLDLDLDGNHDLHYLVDFERTYSVGRILGRSRPRAPWASCARIGEGSCPC